MAEKLTKQQIAKAFDDFKEKAIKLLEDDEKVESFLQDLEKKIKKVPVAGSRLSDLPVFVSLVRSYIKKDYRDIPNGSVIAAVTALVYFFAPLDVVPDYIPVAGFADDAALLAFAEEMIHDDLNDYREWQRQQGKR